MVDLICLANSRKMGARCVAGIRPDTGEWIRPVSSVASGKLEITQIRLSNNADPRCFDLIHVGLSQASPTRMQPENWLIDGKPWELVVSPAPSRCSIVIRDRLFRGALIFGNSSDRVGVETFDTSPAVESLLLLKPINVRWAVGRSFTGGMQARVRFHHNSVRYNLPVTDIIFENKLKNLGLGEYNSGEIGIENEEALFFTISLGEPFNGSCYKLVAAVLELPAGWPAIE